MVVRKIVWTHSSKIELYQILEYFIERNQSKTYSLKLYKKINTEIVKLITQPEIGKITNMINVRALLIESYFIFYEINEKDIVILSVWDTRQNPKKLKF